LSLRNRRQSAVALREREEIRAVLATRRQDEPLYTPKEILRILGWPDDRLRSVQRHAHAIRALARSDAVASPRSTCESDHECGEEPSRL
jgi:hypothetical protein